MIQDSEVTEATRAELRKVVEVFQGSEFESINYREMEGAEVVEKINDAVRTKISSYYTFPAQESYDIEPEKWESVDLAEIEQAIVSRNPAARVFELTRMVEESRKRQSRISEKAKRQMIKAGKYGAKGGTRYQRIAEVYKTRRKHSLIEMNRERLLEIERSIELGRMVEEESAVSDLEGIEEVSEVTGEARRLLGYERWESYKEEMEKRRERLKVEIGRLEERLEQQVRIHLLEERVEKEREWAEKKIEEKEKQRQREKSLVQDRLARLVKAENRRAGLTPPDCDYAPHFYRQAIESCDETIERCQRSVARAEAEIRELEESLGEARERYREARERSTELGKKQEKLSREVFKEREALGKRLERIEEVLGSDEGLEEWRRELNLRGFEPKESLHICITEGSDSTVERYRGRVKKAKEKIEELKAEELDGEVERLEQELDDESLLERYSETRAKLREVNEEWGDSVHPIPKLIQAEKKARKEFEVGSKRLKREIKEEKKRMGRARKARRAVAEKRDEYEELVYLIEALEGEVERREKREKELEKEKAAMNSQISRFEDELEAARESFREKYGGPPTYVEDRNLLLLKASAKLFSPFSRAD